MDENIFIFINTSCSLGFYCEQLVYKIDKKYLALLENLHNSCSSTIVEHVFKKAPCLHQKL